MNTVEAERERIQSEYRRRERELDPTLYAHWQPGEIFMRNERKRVAAKLLHDSHVFPTPANECLEIGYGSIGWLGDLISWGIPETNLHGIELDSARGGRAQAVLPAADLRIGDAVKLPWENEQFNLIIASTLFSSILNMHVRRMIASEITRVIAPGGALLWYDFSVRNPWNPHVQEINYRELQSLFPELQGKSQSLTLAPPLCRWMARKSWLLTTLASSVALLRTHLLAVLIKHE